jgi:hypothetical protein
MESPLDGGTTGEIRRQLAAAQAGLSELEAILAPIPAADARATRSADGDER